MFPIYWVVFYFVFWVKDLKPGSSTLPFGYCANISILLQHYTTLIPEGLQLWFLKTVKPAAETWSMSIVASLSRESTKRCESYYFQLQHILEGIYIKKLGSFCVMVWRTVSLQANKAPQRTWADV